MLAPSPNATPLGRSFRLVDGDLVLTSSGDLAMVSGRDNLLQGLHVMIETPFGSDVFHAGYGFDALAIYGTARVAREVRDLIRLYLVKSISQDNRVTQIKDVLFDDNPQFFDVLPTESPAAHDEARRQSRQWQVIVIMEAVGVGEVAVRVDGTGLPT